jgi:hypothetical protein
MYILLHVWIVYFSNFNQIIGCAFSGALQCHEVDEPFFHIFSNLTVHDYHISCTLHSLIVVYTVLLNKMRELNKSNFAGIFIFCKVHGYKYI